MLTPELQEVASNGILAAVIVVLWAALTRQLKNADRANSEERKVIKHELDVCRTDRTRLDQKCDHLQNQITAIYQRLWEDKK